MHSHSPGHLRLTPHIGPGKMCFYIIHHYQPCHHMRGHCAEQCLVNKATPGITTGDCAARREIYLDDPEPEWDECPICARKKAFAGELVSTREVVEDEMGSNVRANQLTAALEATVAHAGSQSNDGLVALPNTEVTDEEGSVRDGIVPPPNSRATESNAGMSVCSHAHEASSLSAG